MHEEKILPDDPRVTAFALGELEGEAREAMAAAIRTDPALQAAVAEISRFAGMLHGALAEEASAPTPRAEKRPRLLRFPRLLALAGGLATAAALLIFAGKFSRPKPAVAAVSAAPQIPTVAFGVARDAMASAPDFPLSPNPALPHLIPLPPPVAATVRAEQRAIPAGMEEAAELSDFKVEGNLVVAHVAPTSSRTAPVVLPETPALGGSKVTFGKEAPSVLDAAPGAKPDIDITAKPFAFPEAAPPGIAPDDTASRADFTSSVATASNRFALDLYQQLRTREGNLFYSPYSISAALLMAYAGAGGGTEKEMALVLHLALPQPRVAEGFAALAARLARQEGPGLTLSVANALWLQQGLHLQDSFLKVANANYGAAALFTDFSGNPEGARLQINDWVGRSTNNRIQNFIAPGGLSPGTRLVLANAIYFKGTWASRFKPGATHPAPFFAGAGRDLSVPMMHQQARFRLARGDSVSLLELPYAGNGLSMVILLPDQGRLPDLESRLTPENLDRWLTAVGQAPPGEVAVALPRFRATLGYDLSGPLVQLGMVSAFQGGAADFSGMDGARDPSISAVMHKAFVAVDEEGTEAAAATGLFMSGAAYIPAVPFAVDRPFLFLIRENQTGTILFLGRITDPTRP